MFVSIELAACHGFTCAASYIVLDYTMNESIIYYHT